MDSTIFEGLQRDELAFEVLLRGGSPALVTVRQMERWLNEHEDAPFVQELNLDLIGELEVCKTKYALLKAQVETHQGDTESGAYITLSNRLGHVIRRLTALRDLNNPDDVLLGNVDDVIHNLESLDDRLSALALRDKRTQPTPAALAPQRVSMPTLSLGTFEKFSGQGSVYNFLERVDELCLSRGVAHGVIMDSASDLFEGKALEWFRDRRRYIHTWQDLRQALHDAYTSDSDPDTWQRILDTKQDDRTSGRDHFVTMRRLFDRLISQPDDALILDILVRSFSSNYRVAVIGKLPASIEEIYRFVCTFDRLHGSLTPARSVSFSGLQSSSSRPNKLNAPFKITCFNCSQVGHHYNSCPQPKNLFCFRCGKHGVKLPSCPVCNSNQGNSSAKH